MVEAPLDDVLYVGQVIAVFVFEWLYFEGVTLQGWVVGGVGADVCAVVSISMRKGVMGLGRVEGKLSQLVYTKSVFIEEVDRTGSVLFKTGTFFLHQSHHQSAASSYSRSLRMDDIRIQKDFCHIIF